MSSKILNFLYKNNDKNVVYGVLFKNLFELNIKHWKFNRPPDTDRIKHIASHIKEVKYVDGIIYMQYKDNTLYCYDGLHRFEALKLLDKDNYNRISLQNMSIVLNIRINATDGEIMDHFSILNKCVPVPDIYVDVQNAKEIQIIESVVNYFSEKFSSHFSVSRNPNIPNENKDRMKDRLKIMLENHPDKQNYIHFLEEQNKYVKENIPRKITSKQLDKCHKSGFYLFLQREWYTL